MVDPENITNYKLTDAQLEAHILFWVCAAGKNGHTAARCLDKMFKEHNVFYQNNTPFKWVLQANALYDLPQVLKQYGIGCYNHKARTFYELAVAGQKGLNLRTCTTVELEEIYGIGKKTSRCFILHSRHGARYAGLDTHILKHLRAKGIESVPKTTPSSKKEYERLEKEVLKLADQAGMLPAEYDLMVWNKYSKKLVDK